MESPAEHAPEKGFRLFKGDVVRLEGGFNITQTCVKNAPVGQDAGGQGVY